jgi:hypothetical protein
VDGLADIHRVRAHLDGEAHFADHVAGAGADDGAADHAVGFGVEDQLGEAVVGAVGDGAAAGGPRELGGLHLLAFGLGLGFGVADPCHFRVGVGDAGDHGGVEGRLVAGGDFGGHVGFMHGLVGEHGLADDVADGEDVGHVGAHLGIDGDEAAVAHDHAGLVGADLLAVGRAARGLQDHVVLDRFRRSAFAFEAHVEAVFLRLDGDRLGLQHDLVEAAGVLLFPHLDGVAVGALHQAVHHLDHVDAGAEGGIDGGHFEADDAAADDQHLARHEAQLERAGGIDDARVAGMKGRCTAALPAAMMHCLNLTTFLAPVLSWLVPVVSSTSMWFGSRKCRSRG